MPDSGETSVRLFGLGFSNLCCTNILVSGVNSFGN